MRIRDTVARLIADVYAGKLHPRIAAGLARLNVPAALAARENGVREAPGKGWSDCCESSIEQH